MQKIIYYIIYLSLIASSAPLSAKGKQNDAVYDAVAIYIVRENILFRTRQGAGDIRKNALTTINSKDTTIVTKIINTLRKDCKLAEEDSVDVRIVVDFFYKEKKIESFFGGNGYFYNESGKQLCNVDSQHLLNFL